MSLRKIVQLDIEGIEYEKGEEETMLKDIITYLHDTTHFKVHEIQTFVRKHKEKQ